MVHQFEFPFDVPFIKNALRRDYVWRGYVSGLVFFVLATIGTRLMLGGFDPWVTVICFVGALVITLAYRFKIKRYAEHLNALWSKQSPSGKIRWELDEEGLTVHFEQAHSRFEWSGLRKLWCYPDVWLVEILKMQSVFFPPDAAPDEVRAYIRERCEAAGIPVKS